MTGNTMSRRRRSKSSKKDLCDPCSKYSNLPFDGKVVVARKKKYDSLWITLLQLAGICFASVLLFLAYYHPNTFHFHIAKSYALLGHPDAQHIVGHKYLTANGVDQNHTQAFYWFRKAADQGHPHASYNLAAAHLQGFDVDIQQQEAHQLIRHAAAKGVPEAVKALHHICSQGSCTE